MKNFYSLIAICAFLLIPNVIKAEKSDPIPSGTPTGSRVLPITTASSSTTYQISGTVYTSFSQAIYTKTELGASANDITAVEYFIYSGSGSATTRKLQVWIKEIEKDSFVINPGDAQFYLIYDTISGSKYLPGTKVFSGNVDIPASGSYTITFDDAFEWSGNKNICVTVADLTGTDCSNRSIRHAIVPTDRPRFNYRHSSNSSNSYWYWIYNNSLDFWGLRGASELRGMKWTEAATAVVGTQCNQHKYAPKAVFTLGSEAPTAPSTPVDLSVGSITSSSAALSWSSVSGATSYDLQQSADGESWSTLASGLTGTSYSWTGLDAESTHYVQIRANNAVGSSDWSSSVTVTTDPIYEYDDITFNKWTSSNTIPLSGNYYLNNDLSYGWTTADLTLSGDMNLCLNGKTANIGTNKIVVPNGITLTIYNNSSSEGKITSLISGEIETYDTYFMAVIVVRSGGTLVLKEGTIENTYYLDDNYSFAIYSNGTLKLSGDVLINSNDADICLHATNVITIDGAISNEEKHSVYKMSGNITSGWNTYMSSADPKDYFTSANPNKSICRNGNEAALRTLLNLSESLSNSSIGDNYNQTVDVNLTRSLTSSQYNTFCLPFALSNAQLQAAFGSSYDLEEFVEASLDGDQLSLTFNKVTSLTAGKPYLLQPSVDVVNPSFEGVTIGVTAPADQISDTYISFHGTFAPTELTGGNKNLLFLGAGNELFWPDSDGDLKGFRAYFEVKGGAAKVAKRARIINKEEAPTSLDEVQGNNLQRTKFIENGQLFILYNGAKYNVQGQVIK